MIASTATGSMTQETFYHFCQHFVSSLPNSHLPVILVLDGHGSRWSVPALSYLMRHEVYPFFIASHTSIWAQPNDAGVNKRFHWAIEQEVRSARRGQRGVPNIQYFNTILSAAMKRFIEKERCEMIEMGHNSTTHSYERTGLFPLNPMCSAWREAIESIGLKNDEFQTIRYEIVAKKDIPPITNEEEKILRTPYQKMMSSRHYRP